MSTNICVRCDRRYIVKCNGAFCPDCELPEFFGIRPYVTGHVGRSRRRGLPATLTLEEWVKTLDYFGLKCVYCQEPSSTTMDHLIAATKGGGTTKENCVPSCPYCNMKKGNRPFESFASPDARERINGFLQSLKIAT